MCDLMKKECLYVDVGVNEAAVEKLRDYVLATIDAIVVGKFQQYVQEKKRRLALAKKDIDEKKGFDEEPSCFLLQAQTLWCRLQECQQSVAQSIRCFDYPTYSPHI